MARTKSLTPGMVKAALQTNYGLIGPAARALKVSPQTVRRYVREDESIREALWEIRENTKDLCEAQLAKLIKDGHFPAISFYLSTIGRDRGYCRQVEVSGANGGPIQADVKIDFSGLSAEDRDNLRGIVERMGGDDAA